MPLNDGDKERVREGSDIVRVIGEHLALRPKGREFVGLCPFHEDHNPSMFVVPAKQIFKCFVCGAAGDVFSFIGRYHAMDFRAALEYLAHRAGIELTPLQPRSGDRAGDQSDHDSDEPSRSDLFHATNAARDFFRAILAHDQHGTAARELIAARGINAEMVEAFEIGAAPDRWDGLLATVRAKGLDVRPFEDVGLFKPREHEGGHYDALRHRLIFPIHDQLGRIVGFGGRRINDEEDPKYLNSPQTRLFNKSTTLYGLHQAARSIMRERTAIVTEGYTDVIACHQAGLTNTVATLGTALTAGHAALLRRLCDTVVLLFDSDEAGQNAADKATEVFLTEPIDVRIATLTDTGAKDPDELLAREDGKAALTGAIDRARDLLAFRYERLGQAMAGKGIAGTQRLVEAEIAKLLDLGLARVAPLRKQFIIRELTHLTGVPASTIASLIHAGRPARRQGVDLRNEAPDQDAPEDRDPAADFVSRPMTPGEVLLGCVLTDGDLWHTLAEDQRPLLGPEAFASRTMALVAQTVAACAHEHRSCDLASVLEALCDADAVQAAVQLQQRVETESDQCRDRLAQLWADCLTRCDRQRASTGAAEIGVKPSVQARIEAARELAKRAGRNQRALPRPTIAGGA